MITFRTALVKTAPVAAVTTYISRVRVGTVTLQFRQTGRMEEVGGSQQEKTQTIFSKTLSALLHCVAMRRRMMWQGFLRDQVV